MISNCGHDERWQYSGGAAGDQTGTEWQLVPWYSYPWDVMLRYPDPTVRHWMGDQARKAALNNCVGYDQGQRQTFWINLADSDYDAAQITVKCEADCSSGVLAIAKAAGYHFGIEKLQNINQNGYTGNEEQILKGAGFIAYRESKYLTSGAYLDNGDILLNTQNHTAFNVDSGEYCDAVEKPTIKYKTRYWSDDAKNGEISGTTGKAKALEGIMIDPPAGVELEVDIHLQSIGWKTYKGIVAGNRIPLGAEAGCKRIEAIRIRCVKNPTGKKLRYQAHVQTYGWMAVCGEGETAGTTGVSKRLEAFKIWVE